MDPEDLCQVASFLELLLPPSLRPLLHGDAHSRAQHTDSSGEGKGEEKDSSSASEDTSGSSRKTERLSSSASSSTTADPLADEEQAAAAAAVEEEILRTFDSDKNGALDADERQVAKKLWPQIAQLPEHQQHIREQQLQLQKQASTLSRQESTSSSSDEAAAVAGDGGSGAAAASAAGAGAKDASGSALAVFDKESGNIFEQMVSHRACSQSSSAGNSKTNCRPRQNNQRMQSKA